MREMRGPFRRQVACRPGAKGIYTGRELPTGVGARSQPMDLSCEGLFRTDACGGSASLRRSVAVREECTATNGPHSAYEKQLITQLEETAGRRCIVWPPDIIPN
ncbi:hypothetical protein GGP57_000201 [Salinibacter ruber]|nr:hypothetical protein [Salinibacter ruber]MCS3713315.1 hypothetical protein [Salinibacter ruber]